MSREILSPYLMRMKPNRCYRVNLVHEDFSEQYRVAMTSKTKDEVSSKPYTENDLYGEDYNDELDSDEDCEIEEDNGIFKLYMHVAVPFYGGIIGHKGATIKRIRSESQCEITLSSSNTIRDNIIIKALNRSSVLVARRKIQHVLSSLRNRNKCTHFYGVPLNFGEVQEKFLELKRQILASEVTGFEESYFQSEHKLHLTFGTCVLMDDVERSKAMDLLQSCREFLADLNPPINVRVSGLDIMNDDASSVRVLYALIESPELQVFADRCSKRFRASGLQTSKSNDVVKLHMTVMNLRYGDTDAKSFDAREILKRWSNFDFGTVQCSEMGLCVVQSSAKDNYYKIVDSMKF